MRNKIALFATAAVALAASTGVANAQDTSIAWKGAPQFTNDTLTFKVRGRIYYDVVNQDVDFEDPAQAEHSTTTSRIRPARLGIEGARKQNWAYKAEASISSAGGTSQWEALIL